MMQLVTTLGTALQVTTSIGSATGMPEVICNVNRSIVEAGDSTFGGPSPPQHFFIITQLNPAGPNCMELFPVQWYPRGNLHMGRFRYQGSQARTITASAQPRLEREQTSSLARC
ncbi:hypothetical protein F4680DRAFT_45851 [Xylaria scruposa]|nr:hypothetical protein F4680DRAFT_45851 [Xylaria scruposa]